MGFRDNTPEYDNTNRGAIFKAKKKRTDRSPDRTGEISVHCPNCAVVTDFWLSGWLKKAKTSGEIFLSLACNPKDGDSTATEDDLKDEDIPF
jgi:hypothetical protein